MDWFENLKRLVAGWFVKSVQGTETGGNSSRPAPAPAAAHSLAEARAFVAANLRTENEEGKARSRLARHHAVDIEDIAQRTAQAAQDHGILSWHPEWKAWLKAKAKELMINTILNATPDYQDYYKIAYNQVKKEDPSELFTNPVTVALETCAIAEVEDIRHTHPTPEYWVRRTASDLASVQRRGQTRANDRIERFEHESNLGREDFPLAFAFIGATAQRKGLNLGQVVAAAFVGLPEDRQIILRDDMARLHLRQSPRDAAKRFKNHEGDPISEAEYRRWADSAWLEWIVAIRDEVEMQADDGG